MRITLVSTWKIVNAGGEAERVFSLLANAMAERGHQVTGVCFDYEAGQPGFPLDARVRFVNAGVGRKPPLWLTKTAINLRSLSFSRPRRREKRLLLWEKFVGEPLTTAVKRTEPDVVIVFRAADAHLLKCCGNITVPLVVMSHNSTDKFLPNYAPDALKKAVEQSAAVQVLMPEFVDEVKAVIPKARVVVIPNAVPQYRETADRSSHTIINVARISYQKHQDLLVKAFALLADRYPDWQVKIWGGNNDQPEKITELQTLIDQEGLKNRIHLCGTTDRVPQKLMKASILAFPSRWEGFSLALTEAMSLGLPAVGCLNCPSVNHLIRHEENGLLSDDSPQSYARMLSRLMENEELRCRLGNIAKKDMQAYDAENIWQRWETLLFSVTGTEVQRENRHFDECRSRS